MSIKKNYSATEAKKIIDNYIDESALRLSKRLKKGNATQKKLAAKVHAYA